MSFDFSRVNDIMDPENFADLADTVARLKMYPYFDVANYILMCMMVKDDNHPGTTSGKAEKNFSAVLDDFLINTKLTCLTISQCM